MKISGSKITLNQMLLSITADSLSFLSWTKTKDARHGKYKQKSILKTLMGEYDKGKDELMSFDSIEAYEEHMKQFIK